MYKRQLGLLQSLCGVATIRNVGLIADGFLGNPEHAFEKALVELHNIQSLLAQRKFAEDQGADGLRRMQQECATGGDGEQGSPGVVGLAQNGGGARSVDSGVDFFDVEKVLRVGVKLRGGKRGESEDEAVRGKNDEAGAIHINEGHHDGVVGSGQAGPGFRGGTALVAIGEGSFVAVMAVGDDQLPGCLLYTSRCV